jgi:uncharacterized membrane protein
LRVPWWGDLTAAAGLAVVGLVLAVAPVSGPVRTAALLPLILVLPGYALSAALFRPGEISPQLRLVLSVAFSIGVAVLGGLVVQLFVGLDRTVWAVLLAGVTVAAAAIALDRRDAMPADSEDTRVRMPRIGVVTPAAILVAMGIAGSAIAIARDGEDRQRSQAHFSSLWLVPGDSEAGGQPVEVGVSNHEGKAVSYRLVVREGTRTVRRWRVHLESDQSWQAQLAASAISGTAPLVGQLDRGGRPYHRVSVPIGDG